jgi:predicted hotdog family 3-hydroxylacyl-ACP dehydratase
MLAVDELLECADGYATARLVVREGLFARDGRLDSVVLLEYMAQVVAACLGYEAVAEGGAVRVGMVIACRSM